MSMLVTWVVTVRSEMESLTAICWPVRPSVMRCAISSSRRVSWSALPAGCSTVSGVAPPRSHPQITPYCFAVRYDWTASH